MKTIGLIGGLSWHSSAEYYRIINEEIQKKCGEANSAKLILYSFNFQEFVNLQKQNRMDDALQKVIGAGQALAMAGADFIAITANTTHRFADIFEKEVPVPLLHIADPTAESIKQSGFKRIGLLGTKPTMQMDFYKDRLLSKHGLEALVPIEPEMDRLHEIIFTELVNGIIRQDSKTYIGQVIDSLAAQGAQGVILGCTELPLIIKPADSSLPVFDTTRLHAEAIAARAV